MAEHSGKNVFKLGFGLMRLPRKEDGTIDIELTSALTDEFIAGGGTYFDTAYVYDKGGSEAAFRAAVADRYSRSAYTIATKLHAAAICMEAGTELVIVNGARPGILYEVIDGESVGTRFTGRKKHESDN